LPVATVATQTDTCSVEDWDDLLSVTSLVTNDNDDVDSVVGYVLCPQHPHLLRL